MGRRELTRATWPLPWWVALVPGLILGIATFFVVYSARSWPYVAPARLSGMISEAVGLIGPVVCLAAAWVAERFTNRHSPLAWPVVPRANGAQGLRVLGVITISWVSLVVVGGVVAQALVLRQVTGGQFYPVEVIFAGVGLTFFIVSGFVLGTLPRGGTRRSGG